MYTYYSVMPQQFLKYTKKFWNSPRFYKMYQEFLKFTEIFAKYQEFLKYTENLYSVIHICISWHKPILYQKYILGGTLRKKKLVHCTVPWGKSFFFFFLYKPQILNILHCVGFFLWGKEKKRSMYLREPTKSVRLSSTVELYTD